MIGRRSIWSQPQIIEISGQFVTATDEVWRLQNGTDPECRHFQKIANAGHYRKHRSTRQGIYVATPSGMLLGSLNSHNVEAVLEMLQVALERYQALERHERLLPEDAEIQPSHRWEDSFPEKGLHLTMTTRDLPESGQPDDPPAADWNQDRVWFSQAEAAGFLPGSRDNWRPGFDYPIPRPLLERIVRFSLVDTVRGQTTYFAPEEIAHSVLRGRVVAATEERVRIEIHGTTEAESAESRGRNLPHGVATRVIGHAVWETALHRFSEFELVAIGSRWGRTVFNGRRNQLERSPAGFVFQLTDPRAPRIAPSFLFAYGADWVRYP